MRRLCSRAPRPRRRLQALGEGVAHGMEGAPEAGIVSTARAPDAEYDTPSPPAVRQPTEWTAYNPSASIARGLNPTIRRSSYSTTGTMLLPVFRFSSARCRGSSMSRSTKGMPFFCR